MELLPIPVGVWQTQNRYKRNFYQITLITQQVNKKGDLFCITGNLAHGSLSGFNLMF